MFHSLFQVHDPIIERYDNIHVSMPYNNTNFKILRKILSNYTINCLYLIKYNTEWDRLCYRLYAAYAHYHIRTFT